MGQSVVILTCENPACSKEFAKPIAEFKRSVKLGRQHFCSLKCFAQFKDLRNFKDKINISTERLKKGSDRDQFSPFRQHLKIIKKSSKQRNKKYSITLEDLKLLRQHLNLARKRVKSHGRDCTINLQYLKELWEKQEGCCPYTGWKLDNPRTTTNWNGYRLHPKRASLDRIDSSVGYVLGNVQFLSVIANYAKSIFLEEELLEFCQAAAEYRRGNR